MVDGMSQREIIEEVEGERMEAVKKQVPEMVKEETTPKKGKYMSMWWKTYYVYAVSSLIILITVVVVLAVKHFWPFGNGTLLNGDFIAQGWPFIMEFKEKLASGDSLLYTWNAGFGTNFYSILSYGMFNPFTLIYMLVPEKYILQTSTILFVINLLAMNGTMLYFLSHRPVHALPQKRIVNMLFSLSYTLCMYTVSNINNWTFLIVAAIFPLIILGLEQFVANKGWKLYFITLMLSFLFNYYFTGLFCIFIVLYYLTLEFGSFRIFAKKSGKILLLSVLAIAVSSVLMVPTALQMAGQRYTKSELLDQTWFTTFFDIIKNFFALNRAVDRGSSYDSYGEVNLYYGLLMLMLTSLYFLNGKIKLSVRLKNLVLVALYIIAFNCNGLNYVFHMMHYPTWFPNRFSLFFTLLCIILAYEGWVALEETKFQSLTLIKGVLVGMDWAVLTVLCFAFAETVEYQFTYYFSIMIFLFYMVALLVISLLKGKGKQILVVLGCVELVLNFDYAFIYRSASQSASDYAEVKESEQEVLDMYIGDEMYGYARILEGNDIVTGSNGGLLFDKKTNSIFASSMSNVNAFLRSQGVVSGGNMIQSYTYTPATMSMMNLQYIIYDYNVGGKKMPEELYSAKTNVYDHYEKIAEQQDIVIYENPTVLSLGYMIDPAAEGYYSDLIEAGKQSGYAPDAINAWVEAVSGVSDVIKPVQLTIQDVEALNCEAIVADGVFYAMQKFGQQDIDTITENAEQVWVKKDSGDYSREDDSVIRLDCVAEEAGEYYVDMGLSYASLGYMEAGEECHIYYKLDKTILNNNMGYSSDIQTYAFDYDQWQKAYDILSQQQMEVTNYTSTEVEGTIDVEQDGLLFTSIPYDDNWNVYVDGKEAEIVPLWDSSFIALRLDAGEHTIQAKYKQRGIVWGGVLSVAAILLSAGLIVYTKKKKDIVLEDTETDGWQETFYSEEDLLERQERQKRKKQQENPEEE